MYSHLDTSAPSGKALFIPFKLKNLCVQGRLRTVCLDEAKALPLWGLCCFCPVTPCQATYSSSKSPMEGSAEDPAVEAQHPILASNRAKFCPVRDTKPKVIFHLF